MKIGVFKIAALLLALSVAVGSPCLAGVTRDAFPEIYMEYSSGAPVDLESVRMFLDGTEVTGSAEATSRRVFYVPSTPLATGRHTVRVTVSDLEGRTIQKTWNFIVDPNAEDAEPPVLGFVPPTPENGAALGEGEPGRFALQADDGPGTGVDPASLYVNLFKDGRLVRTFRAEDLARENDRWVSGPLGLETGNYTLAARASDFLGNRAEEATVGFSLDREAPTVESVSFVPERGRVDGKWSVLTALSDRPRGALAEWSVSVSRNGRTVFQGEDIARDGLNRLDFPLEKGRTYQSGWHDVAIRVRDYAGAQTEKKIKTYLAFDGMAFDGAGSETSFRPDPLDPETSRDYTTIVGRGDPGLSVVILRNGAPVGEGRVEEDGTFRSDSISLDPGANEFTFETEKDDGLTEPLAGRIFTFHQPVEESPADEPEEPSFDFGVEPPAVLTNQPSIDLEGWGSPGLIGTLYQNGNPAGVFTIDAGGRWTLTGVELTEGENRFGFELEDPRSGTTAASPEELRVALDTTAPEIGEPDAPLNDRVDLPLTLRIPIFDDSPFKPEETRVHANLDNKEGELGWSFSDGILTVILDESIEKRSHHTLTVVAADAAGNEKWRRWIFTTPGGGQ